MKNLKKLILLPTIVSMTLSGCTFLEIGFLDSSSSEDQNNSSYEDESSFTESSETSDENSSDSTYITSDSSSEDNSTDDVSSSGEDSSSEDSSADDSSSENSSQDDSSEQDDSSSEGSSTEEGSGTDSSEEGSSSSYSEGTESGSERTFTFSHVFTASDFNSTSAGSSDINGLTFNYTASSYLSGANGCVQIGSGNNPQKTAWTLSAAFPCEVTMLDYEIVVFAASSGSGTVDVKMDSDYTYSKYFSGASASYINDNPGLATDDFAFSMTSTADKAMYLYSLSFEVYVEDESVSDFLYTDEEVASAVTPGENSIPETVEAYADITKENYYTDVDLNLTGSSLTSELRTLVSDMTAYSYETAKYALQYTDEDPDNPGYDYGLYDGHEIKACWDSSATWNREHVWPRSRMILDNGSSSIKESTKNNFSDLHNLRVSCPQSNSLHSNKYYAETDSSNAMYPNVSGLSGVHTYNGDHRGDVARICFYMYVRYDGLTITDDTTILESGTDNTMGVLSTLLKWNEADPVDSFETQRNNRICRYQGNRNPFIDYPELANRIFEA